MQSAETKLTNQNTHRDHDIAHLVKSDNKEKKISMAAFNFQFNSGPSSPPRYFHENSTDYTPSQPTSIEHAAQQIALQQGVPIANFFIGRCFDTGEGVPQNSYQAAEYYHAAAAAGLAEAQHNLACCFLNGEGVAVDLKTALQYFVAAAKQGHPPAIYNIGNMIEAKDPARAAQYYHKAAKKGHVQAYFSLGCMYDTGKGVNQNYEEAARLYFQASEQGLPEAQFNLACSYAMGQGVPHNLFEAVRYYTLAAEQGHAMAQFNLAQCYQEGKGVGMNQAGAVHYYQLAAQQGIAVPLPVPTPAALSPPVNHFLNGNNIQQRPRSVSFQAPQVHSQPLHIQRARSQTQGQNIFGNGRGNNMAMNHRQPQQQQQMQQMQQMQQKAGNYPTNFNSRSVGWSNRV